MNVAFQLVLLTSPPSVSTCGRRWAEEPEQSTGSTASLFFLLPSSRASRTFRASRKMTRSCRLAHKAPVMQARHDHAIPLFLEADVLPVTSLYYESVSILMHDISNDKAPANMLNLFQKTSNIYSYNTRSCTSGKFYVKSAALEIQMTKQFFPLSWS